MKTISKTEFARLVGVTQGRISQLVRAGLPVRPDGRIDQVGALAWLEKHVDREAGGWHLRRSLNSQNNEKAAADWDRARVLVVSLRCRMLKRQLDAIEGKLLDAAAVRGMNADAYRLISEATLSIPDKLAPAIASATSQAQIHEILKSGITAELHHIAEVLEER